MISLREPGFIVRESIGVLATPIARESHPMVDVRHRASLPASSSFLPRALPQSHRRVVLSEPLSRAGQRRHDLFARRVGYGRVLVQLLEGRGEIIGCLAVGVFLQRAASGRVQVPDGLAAKRLRMRSRKV